MGWRGIQSPLNLGIQGVHWEYQEQSPKGCILHSYTELPCISPPWSEPDILLAPPLSFYEPRSDLPPLFLKHSAGWHQSTSRTMSTAPYSYWALMSLLSHQLIWALWCESHLSLQLLIFGTAFLHLSNVSVLHTASNFSWMQLHSPRPFNFSLPCSLALSLNPVKHAGTQGLHGSCDTQWSGA